MTTIGLYSAWALLVEAGASAPFRAVSSADSRNEEQHGGS